jgi:2-polyprenyl-6-methoxyphenol hydroxylase-like FAD-dependent oxidoreductase
MKTKTTVLIVGGGPVGLLMALRLGQAGIDTLIVEKHPSFQPATRAMVYMPVVISALTKLGLYDQVRSAAYLNQDGVYWRDTDMKPLARLPLGDPQSSQFNGVLQLGQWKMSSIISEELQKHASVELHFGYGCVGVQEDANGKGVQVLLQSKDDPTDTLIEAEYVVGCDGANSSVRKAMCIPYEGFSYPWKMIGCDVLYDFPKQEGLTPLNFVVDETDWAVIAYTGEDEDGKAGYGREKTPLWRVAYIENSDLPSGKEDFLSRAKERIPASYIKHGDGKFNVIRAEPYTNHQRCAAQARKGRVFLAGDALHVSTCPRQ